MKFLSTKFFDEKGLVNKFVSSKNELLSLETELDDNLKKEFRDNFIKALIAKGIIKKTAIQKVDDAINPWSIDFPGWFGAFNEKVGKKIFIIGSEPHIHNRYLQTVYGFNSKVETNPSEGILYYLTTLLKPYLKMISSEEVLKECYLTDLVPFSPLKSNGKAVGSAKKIQEIIEGEGNWLEIRSDFAKMSLKNEIIGVKPQLIIAQGKEVFEELLNVLGIKDAPTLEPIEPIKGKKQYIRKVEWENIHIVSVPHIGSRRIGTFWKNNLEKVCVSFSKILKLN